MDITSFSLGISFAVVVGMLAVTVYNLFRLQKMNKEIKEISHSSVDNYRALLESSSMAIDGLYKEINIRRDENERQWSDHQRSLDSRLDKLIHRLDRLERERLGTTRDDEAISGRVKKLQKELLND
jgi:hypothetical protein